MGEKKEKTNTGNYLLFQHSVTAFLISSILGRRYLQLFHFNCQLLIVFFFLFELAVVF